MRVTKNRASIFARSPVSALQLLAAELPQPAAALTLVNSISFPTNSTIETYYCGLVARTEKAFKSVVEKDAIANSFLNAPTSQHCVTRGENRVRTIQPAVDAHLSYDATLCDNSSFLSGAAVPRFSLARPALVLCYRKLMGHLSHSKTTCRTATVVRSRDPLFSRREAAPAWPYSSTVAFQSALGE